MSYLNPENTRFAEISYSDLGQLLLQQRTSEALDRSRSLFDMPNTLSKGRILVGWHEVSGLDQSCPFPSIIIVAEGQKEAFFAWSLSTVAAFAPLTSLVRIIDWRQWQLWMAQLKQIDPKRVGRSPVVAAMILGEIATEAEGDTQFQNLSISTFESSCSYAVFQACVSGVQLDGPNEAGSRWELIRSVVGMPKRNLKLEDLLRVWKIVIGQENLPKTSESLNDREMAQALEVLGTERRLPDHFLSNLFPRFKGNIEFDAIGSKEKRVIRFNEFCSEILDYQLDGFLGGFLIGCLATLISPGETKHTELVRGKLKSYPTALLWYFVAASLQDGSRVLAERRGLGRRCLNQVDLEASLFQPPTCDVSLEEYLMMQRNQGAQFELRLHSSNILRVELMPAVTTVVRKGASSPGDKQMDLFPDRGSKDSMDVNEISLSEVIGLLREDLNLLEGLVKGKRRKR